MKNTIFKITLGLAIIIGLAVLTGKDSTQIDTTETIEETESNSIDESTKQALSESDNTVTQTEIVKEKEYEEEITFNPTNTTVEQEPTKNDEPTIIVQNDDEPTPEELELLESYVSQELSSSDVLKLLSNSLVTKTAGYSEHFGSLDTLNVFAEDITNSFSINTAAWYNMWGGSVQSCVFSTKKLQEQGNLLSFDVGLMSGSEDTLDVKIYVSNPDFPDYEFTLNATEPPQRHEIDISTSDTLKIELNNHAGVQNKAVFYNFELQP